jgi:hypothetical protein
MLIESLCRRWNLWGQIEERHFKKAPANILGSNSAQMLVAQLLFSRARGGATIQDAALLHYDQLLTRLIGVTQWADEATLTSWADLQNDAAIKTMSNLNAVAVRGALRDYFLPKTGKDKLPLAVTVRCLDWNVSEYHGAVTTRPSNENQRLYLLSVGPFAADWIWMRDHDYQGCGDQFQGLVARNTELWRERTAVLVSGELEGKGWETLTTSFGFSSGTAAIDRSTVSSECPFSPIDPTIKWTEQSADGLSSYIITRPVLSRRRDITGAVAVKRRTNKAGGEHFEYLEVPRNAKTPIADYFEMHNQAWDESDRIVADLNLQDLVATNDNTRDLLTSVSILAHNLLIALRCALLGNDASWSAREMIHRIIATPARLSTSGGNDILYVSPPQDLAAEWTRILAESGVIRHS